MALFPGKEPRVPLGRRFDVYSVGSAIHSSVSFWGLWRRVVLQVASHVLEVGTVCSVQTLVTDSARLRGVITQKITL
jgi:hypothetical protein